MLLIKVHVMERKFTEKVKCIINVVEKGKIFVFLPFTIIMNGFVKFLRNIITGDTKEYSNLLLLCPTLRHP